MAARFHQLIDPSSDQLISQISEKCVASIVHAWRENREAQIVLTGGRTGLAIARSIDVALFRATSQDSSSVMREGRVRIWFSDERFVDLEDSDRSDTQLLTGFTKANSHLHFERVAAPGSTNLEGAAKDYALALETRLGGNSRFDAVILSMGEDGHIASLFPGHTDQLNSAESAVAVDNSPKPPAQRVSIGVARLAKASAIYIFALGEGKREALQALLNGKKAGSQSPISKLRECSPATQIFIATDLKI